jgi:hypothetical protein
VGGAAHARDRIREQQRDAIGRERGEHRADPIADQAVELRLVGQRLADPPDVRAVDVAHRLELRRVVARVRGEQPAILVDVRPVVAPAIAEVQRRARPGRHAAGALGKPMNEPREIEHGRAVQPDHRWLLPC